MACWTTWVNWLVATYFCLLCRASLLLPCHPFCFRVVWLLFFFLACSLPCFFFSYLRYYSLSHFASRQRKYFFCADNIFCLSSLLLLAVLCFLVSLFLPCCFARWSACLLVLLNIVFLCLLLLACNPPCACFGAETGNIFLGRGKILAGSSFVALRAKVEKTLFGSGKNTLWKREKCRKHEKYLSAWEKLLFEAEKIPYDARKTLLAEERKIPSGKKTPGNEKMLETEKIPGRSGKNPGGGKNKFRFEAGNISSHKLTFVADARGFC